MKKNWLEWTVFGISLALIVAVAGLLVYQEITGGESPASLVADAGVPTETAGGYAVPIDVRNVGDTSAEDVQVEATLTWAGGMERGEALIPLVPYRSKRRAWIAFSHDPRGGEIRVRVLGYREP
ncbi:MAG TPA: hypothetical protein VGD94_21210 [Vicinamibacterales bacterium]